MNGLGEKVKANLFMATSASDSMQMLASAINEYCSANFKCVCLFEGVSPTGTPEVITDTFDVVTNIPSIPVAISFHEWVKDLEQAIISNSWILGTSRMGITIVNPVKVNVLRPGLILSQEMIRTAYENEVFVGGKFKEGADPAGAVWEVIGNAIFRWIIASFTGAATAVHLSYTGTITVIENIIA